MNLINLFNNIALILFVSLLTTACASTPKEVLNNPPHKIAFKLGSHKKSATSTPYPSNDTTQSLIYLEAKTLLDGSHIKSSKVHFDQHGYPAINLTLNKQGTILFAKTSSENIGKLFAILVDDQVIIAPIIQSEIKHGHFVISGLASTAEANTLNARIQAAIR